MGFGNLGIALGAGVNEWHKQQEEARKQQLADQQKTTFDQQQAEYARKMDIQKQGDDLMKQYRAYQQLGGQIDQLGDADLPAFAERFANDYNSHPAFADGKHARITTMNGQPVAVIGSLSRNDVQIQPVTREMLKQSVSAMSGSLRDQLAALDPNSWAARYDAQEKLDLERHKLKTEDRKVDGTLAHYERSDTDAANRTGIMGKHYDNEYNLGLGRLNLGRAELAQRGQQARMGAMVMLPNENGEAVAVVPTIGKDGRFVPQQQVLPGLRLTPKMMGKESDGMNFDKMNKGLEYVRSRHPNFDSMKPVEQDRVLASYGLPTSPLAMSIGTEPPPQPRVPASAVITAGNRAPEMVAQGRSAAGIPLTSRQIDLGSHRNDQWLNDHSVWSNNTFGDFGNTATDYDQMMFVPRGLRIQGQGR